MPLKPEKWVDLSYYGRKLKRRFIYIDTVLQKKYPNQKELETKANALDEVDIDNIIKLTTTMSHLAKSIEKLVDAADTTNRLADIEALLKNLPPQLLQEAQAKIGK